MVTWFEAKKGGEFPVVGLEGSGGQLLGFASYGPLRAWPAYRYSVEHSVYVQKDNRGKDLGRVLMTELIAAAGVVRPDVELLLRTCSVWERDLV